jgi:hypothetical protein
MKKLLKNFPIRIMITKYWENKFNLVWDISFFFLHQPKEIDIYLKNIKYREGSEKRISTLIDKMHEEDEYQYYLILSMIENYSRIFKDPRIADMLTKKLNEKME